MDRFSPVHFLFLMLGVGIVSIKTYPRIFIVNGLRDTWIALIISSILIFVIVVYIIRVWKNCNDEENKNIVELYQYALGEKLGNIFIAFFVVALYLTLLESSAVEADSMHTNMSLETPRWLFLLFFVFPSIYIVRKKITAIFITTVIVIVMIMLSGINLAILTAPYKQPAMLLPILEEGVTPGFFISILETLGLYGCISITLPFLSRLSDNKTKLMKYIIIALILIIQIEIVSITGVLMTFDPIRVISMNYPKLVQTQLVSYFQFMDFGELYVMLQVQAGFLIKYIITFYAILIIARNYNMNTRIVNIAPYFISVAVFICSYLLSKNPFILFNLLNIYQYLCLFNFVLVPFFVFVILHYKKSRQLS